MAAILLNFVEAVVNLFMELHALNLTNLINLDVKLMEILVKTRILYQANSILQRKVENEKALVSHKIEDYRKVQAFSRMRYIFP